MPVFLCVFSLSLSPEISIVDDLPVSSTAAAPAIFGLHHHQQTYQTPQLPPFKFQYRVYNVSIRENSVGKTYAVQPTNEARMGISSAPDIDIKYRIIAGDKDKLFKAEERTVGDFTFLAIRTRTGNVVLNREKIDSYHLKVRATGTRRDYKTKIVQEDECIVNVIVIDTNDLSPFFYPNEYAITVPEDMALHQNIVKVMAEDADLGINGEIYYSFLEETDSFSVHPTSGVITLTRPLKYIEKSLHELIVIANDRGTSPSNRQPSKAKVKIRVKQVSFFSFVLHFFCPISSVVFGLFFCVSYFVLHNAFHTLCRVFCSLSRCHLIFWSSRQMRAHQQPLHHSRNRTEYKNIYNKCLRVIYTAATL